MFRMAYCGIPHTGGTYTVYKMLRQGLTSYDTELRWVGIPKSGFTLPEAFKEEENYGELITKESSDHETGIKFIEHITKNYQGVIFNVLTDKISTNAARYIPNHILKLEIVHNITPATYRAAQAIKDNVHTTIAIAPRIKNDLITKFNFSETKIKMIPHAVNLEAFQKRSIARKPDEPLKLIYLGRIEENAKGVLWLPDIIQNCLKIGVNASLTVVGDGKDLIQLKKKTSQMELDNYIHCLGGVAHANVPELFAQHHVFLMPSRYEGFGYTLVEAMASGCVPICSRISGVTDFIVSHGENGLLFKVGDVNQAAKFVSQLNDSEVWQRLSSNAIMISQSCFSKLKRD